MTRRADAEAGGVVREGKRGKGGKGKGGIRKEGKAVVELVHGSRDFQNPVVRLPPLGDRWERPAHTASGDATAPEEIA